MPAVLKGEFVLPFKYKVTEHYRRSIRLTNANEFTSILNNRCVIRSLHFSVYAKPNANSIGRLGMTVAKRVAARAVDRNYIKRIVREVFRRHSSYFAGIDVVVQSKQRFDQGKYGAIESELLNTLARVRRKCLASC